MPPPPFLTSSVTSAFTSRSSHCTARVLYACLMCKGGGKSRCCSCPENTLLAAAIFRGARAAAGAGLVLASLTPALCQAKTAVCMRLVYVSCPWDLEQNEIYLNYYFGDKEQRQDSSNDYPLVMILHSSVGLVTWLSRTTATRIWVANADMKTWGNIKSCRRIPLAVMRHRIVSGAPPPPPPPRL